jgi:hypothetical protein
MYDAGEWLEHYAPGFHNLTPGERSALSDFVLLWSLFEGQVLARNATVNLMFATIEGWQEIGALDDDRVRDAWVRAFGPATAVLLIQEAPHLPRPRRMLQLP